MAKLTEIVAGLALHNGEAEPITDMPLGPREPAPARDVVIAARPQVVGKGGRPPKARAEIAPDRIEPIPERELEIAVAQPSGRSQEDYMQAAQAANRRTRQAQRQQVGHEPVSEIAKVELAQALVGNLRRKDRGVTVAEIIIAIAVLAWLTTGLYVITHFCDKVLVK